MFLLKLDKIIFILIKLIILIMFLLYYLINFINLVVYLNINTLNNLYISFNRLNLIFKKSFDKITFFEKFTLIFFHNSDWFFKSILSFTDFSKNINDLKKNNFPLINFLHYYNHNGHINFNKLFYIKSLYTFFKKKKFFKNLSFSDYLVFQYFFNKKYYSFLNLNFYKNKNLNNILKLNYLFFYFNKFFNNKKILKLNLNYYNDWFYFNFYDLKKNKKFKKIDFDKTFLIMLKEKKFKYIKKVIILYNKSFNLDKFKKNDKINFFKHIKSFSNNFYKKNNFYKNINFNKNFFKNLFNNLPTRFSESSVNKYINYKNSNNYNFYYLRKNKIFNKGRYSRNRQLYRTGVYWCLWLNIMIVYGLYFFFYRFTFNFGYIWLGLFLIAFSTIFSRIVKYRFYNLFFLINEFNSLLVWFGHLINNFILNLNIFVNKLQIKNTNNIIIFNSLGNFLSNLFIFNLNFFKFFNHKKDYGFVYIWKNYGKTDTSFLKYKSLLNWFKQLYKVLTY